MVDIKDPTYFFSQSRESGVYLDRAEVIGCQGGGERAMNSISYAGFTQLSCSFVLVYTRFEYQWLFPTPHNQFPPVNHKVLVIGNRVVIMPKGNDSQKKISLDGN